MTPLTILAQAQPAAPQPTTQTVPDPGSQTFSMFVMMGLMIGIFYFLIIRPQRKRERERLAMIDKLQKNDRVLTGSGIYGTVYAVKDSVIILKVDDDSDTKLRIAKSAVAQVERGEDERK